MVVAADQHRWRAVELLAADVVHWQVATPLEGRTRPGYRQPDPTPTCSRADRPRWARNAGLGQGTAPTIWTNGIAAAEHLEARRKFNLHRHRELIWLIKRTGISTSSTTSSGSAFVSRHRQREAWDDAAGHALATTMSSDKTRATFRQRGRGHGNDGIVHRAKARKSLGHVHRRNAVVSADAVVCNALAVASPAGRQPGWWRWRRRSAYCGPHLARSWDGYEMAADRAVWDVATGILPDGRRVHRRGRPLRALGCTDVTRRTGES